MTAMYSLNMNKLQHNLLCDGRGAVFSLDGRYVGEAVNMTGARPVDVISLLQQGTLAEIAVLCNGRYFKQEIELAQFQTWLTMIPVQPKTTLCIKRLVGNEKCMQTIYLFDIGRIGNYLNSLNVPMGM